MNIASEWRCAILTWWEPRLLFLPWASLLSPCQTRGCHWSGKRVDRPAHQQVCLVNRINNLRLYVDELEDAILEYDKRVLDLETALYEQFGQNQDLRAEVETLKGETDLDKEVIESLRLQLGGSATCSSMGRGERGRADGVIVNSENTLDEAVTEGQDAALKFWLAVERGEVASLKVTLDNMAFMETSTKISQRLGRSLHIAAGCGHAHVVEALLDCGYSEFVDALDHDGNSALHMAALNGRHDVVRVLLASETFGCICLPNVAAKTALHCAAVQGNQEVVEMLLCNERFTDEAVNALAKEDMPCSLEEVQVTIEEGLTALHLAAKFGHVGVVQALLNAERFNALDDATALLGYSPLHIAARYGHSVVATTLLQCGRFNAINALDVFGCSALHILAFNGSPDLVKLLLDEERFTRASHQNSRWQTTALHAAAHAGHVEVARLLLASANKFPDSAVNALGVEGETALHTAAHHGSPGIVKLLLEEPRFTSASHQTTRHQSTVLHVAAGSGDVEVARLLLTSANRLPDSAVNALGVEGETALHTAAHHGSSAVVKLLLEEPRFTCASHQTPKHQSTALHVAADLGHVEVAELLLTSANKFHDSAVNALGVEGETALHIAAHYGNPGIVKLLLEEPRFTKACHQTTKHQSTALHSAAGSGHVEVARLLLTSANRFPDSAVNALGDEGDTALHTAAHYGRSGIVKLLLEEPRFTSASHQTKRHHSTALHSAADSGHAEVVQLLLTSANKFPDSAVNALGDKGETALHSAAHHGSSAVVKLLLGEPRFTSASQKNTTNQATALHVAVGRGHVEATQRLLMAIRFPTSAVNTGDKEGSSALHWAAWLGHCDIVEELLNSDRFTSVNSRNKFGSTAVHTAAFKGQTSVLEVLLANPRFTASNLPNSVGHNALHLATMQGHSESVKALLASGRFDTAAVNAATLNDGETALHLAMDFRRVPVARLLLRCQRFTTMLATTAREERTALHLAAACRDSDDVACLTEALLGSDQFTAEASEAQDKSGRTALHLMVERGHLEAAQMLQKSGKFTAVAAREGRGKRTALDIAKARGNTEMIGLLESWSS